MEQLKITTVHEDAIRRIGVLQLVTCRAQAHRCHCDLIVSFKALAIVITELMEYRVLGLDGQPLSSDQIDHAGLSLIESYATDKLGPA